MKVTFYSNFFTHHQLDFCTEMEKALGDNFKFVAMEPITKMRLDLGFEDLNKKYDFIVRSYESDEEYNRAKELALDSDVVIIGSTTDDLIEERLKQDKLIFRYRARIFAFPDGFYKTIFNKDKMKLFFQRHIKYRKNKNLYLLCANAYGKRDFNRFGLYKNKIYKWGYFLINNYYDIDELLVEKEKNNPIQIVWVARFIKCKHPEVVVKLAKNLKKYGYKFKIQMIGNGTLEKKIKNKIEKQNLNDVIELVGQVPSSKIKDYMENANIFITTSDHNENWGVVVNEAMNGGCAIVASKKMGSVPFLIGNNNRGFMYDNYKDLEEKVKLLIDDKDLRNKLSKNAYDFITTKWTGSLAAENLIHLFEEIIDNKQISIKDGPGSKL